MVASDILALLRLVVGWWLDEGFTLLEQEICAS